MANGDFGRNCFQPGLQIVAPEFFNQMTTMHGLIMVFGAVMPAFVGLAKLDDTDDELVLRIWLCPG